MLFRSGRYADILELAHYNNVLAGLSQDGEHYFYDNKLESDGSHHRWEWHPCPCCTMNVSRLLASVGGYVFGVSDEELAIHLYGGATVRANIGGADVLITEVSDYPWDGNIRIEVTPDHASEFGLALRIPAWATDFALSINGRAVHDKPENGYVRIRKVWNPGDVVKLHLPLAPKRLYPDPRIRQTANRVALARGPLVYCIEQRDHQTPIWCLRLPPEAQFSETRQRIGSVDVTAIAALGQAAEIPQGPSALYTLRPPSRKEAWLTAIPYFLWCNRGANEMSVWLPE